MQEIADNFAKKSNGNSIFYLCNPNNPTGVAKDSNFLFDWINSFNGKNFFIIDEDYIDFAQIQLKSHWN